MTATRSSSALPRSPHTPTAKTKSGGPTVEPDCGPSGTAGNSLSGKSTPQGALSPSLFDSLQQRASKLKVLLGSLQTASAGRTPGTAHAEGSATSVASAVGSNTGQATCSSDSTRPGVHRHSSAVTKTGSGAKLDSAAPQPAPAIAATATGGASRARAGSWSSGARTGDTGPAGQRAQGPAQAKAPAKHKEAVSPSLILKDGAAEKGRPSCAEGAQAAPKPTARRAAPAIVQQIVSREAVKQRRSASDGGAAATGAPGILDRRSPAGILIMPVQAAGTAEVGGRATGDTATASATGSRGALPRASAVAPAPAAASTAPQPAPPRSYAALAQQSMQTKRGSSGGGGDQQQRSAHTPPLPPPPPLPTQPAKARASRSPSASPPESARGDANRTGYDGGSAVPPVKAHAILQVAAISVDPAGAPVAAAATAQPPALAATGGSDGGCGLAEELCQAPPPPPLVPADAVFAHHRPRSQAAEELSAILASLASESAPANCAVGEPDESLVDAGGRLVASRHLQFGTGNCGGALEEDLVDANGVIAIPYTLGGSTHHELMSRSQFGAENSSGGANGLASKGRSVGGDTAPEAAPADAEAALAQALAVARASALAAFLRPEARVYRPRPVGFKTSCSGSSSPTAVGAATAAGGPGQSQVFVGVSAAAAPFQSSGPDGVGGSPRGGGASSGVESARSPCALSPSAHSSRYEKLLMLKEGGNGGRPRSSSAGAPAPDFMRRNAILLKKRQAWAACKGKTAGSPSNGRQQSQVERAGAALAPEDEEEPEPPPARRRVSSAGTSGRSLVDLQRWADRREKRLAVLREEREAEERARADVQLTFKPAIGERSRRLAKLARSRPSYVPLPGCSPPPRSPTPPPGASVRAGGDSAQGRAVSAGPCRPSGPVRPLLRACSAARVRAAGVGRSSIGGTSVASTVEPASSPARSPADLRKITRGSRPWQQTGPAGAAGGSVQNSLGCAVAASSGGGAGPSRVGVRSSKGSVVAQLAAARNIRTRGRYAAVSGLYDDPVVGSVADAIKSATAALKLRPAQSRRNAPVAQSLTSQARQSVDAEFIRTRSRARQRLLSQSLQQQQQPAVGRGVRVSLAGSAALSQSQSLGAGSPRRHRRASMSTAAAGVARARHSDPHSAKHQQRRQSAPFAGLDLWESPQPHSPHAYAHGGSRRPSVPPSPLPGAAVGLHSPALGSARNVSSPQSAASARGVADPLAGSQARTPPQGGSDTGVASRVARRTIELLGSGGGGAHSGISGSGGLAVRTGRSPMSGSVTGFGSEVSGSGGAASARLRFSLGNEGGSPYAGSPIILMVGNAASAGATGSPLDAAAAVAAATTTMVGPGGVMVQVPQVVRLVAASPDVAQDSPAAAALRLSAVGGVGGNLMAAPAAASVLAVGAFRYGSLASSPTSSYLPHGSPLARPTGQATSVATAGGMAGSASGGGDGTAASPAAAPAAAVDVPALPATEQQLISAAPTTAQHPSGHAPAASHSAPVAVATAVPPSARAADTTNRNLRGSSGGAGPGSSRGSSARGSHGGAPLQPAGRPGHNHGHDHGPSPGLGVSAAAEAMAADSKSRGAALTNSASRGSSSGGCGAPAQQQPQPAPGSSRPAVAGAISGAAPHEPSQAAATGTGPGPRGSGVAEAEAGAPLAAAAKDAAGCFSPPHESTYSLASLHMASPSRPAGNLLRGVRFTKILAQQFAAGLMSSKPSSPSATAAPAANHSHSAPLATSMSAPVSRDTSFTAGGGVGDDVGDGAAAGSCGGAGVQGSSSRLCVEPRCASAPSGMSGWLQAYREAYGRSGRQGAGSGYPGLRFVPLSLRTGRKGGGARPEGAADTAAGDNPAGAAETDTAVPAGADANGAKPGARPPSDAHTAGQAGAATAAEGEDAVVERTVSVAAAAARAAGSRKRAAESDGGSASAGGGGPQPVRPCVVTGAGDMVMTTATAPRNSAAGGLVPSRGPGTGAVERRSVASSSGGGSHESEDPLAELQSLIWRMKHLAEDCDALAAYTSSAGGSSSGGGHGRFSSAGGSGSAGTSAGGGGASAGGGIAGRASCAGGSSAGGAVMSCSSSSGGQSAGSGGGDGSATVSAGGGTAAHHNFGGPSAACPVETGLVKQSAAATRRGTTDLPSTAATQAAARGTEASADARPAADAAPAAQPAGSLSTPRNTSTGSSTATSCALEPVLDTSPAAGPMPVEVLVRRAEQLRASLLSSLGSSPVSASPSGSWAGTASQRASPSPLRPAGGATAYSPAFHTSAGNSARRSGVASVSSGSGASLSPIREVGAAGAGGGGAAAASRSASGSSVNSEFFFPRLPTDAAAAGGAAAVGVKALQLVPMADWPPPAPRAAAAPPGAWGNRPQEAEEMMHEISLAGSLEQPPPLGARQPPRRLMTPALASAAEELAAAAGQQPRYSVWSLADHLPPGSDSAAGETAATAGAAVAAATGGSGPGRTESSRVPARAGPEEGNAATEDHVAGRDARYAASPPEAGPPPAGPAGESGSEVTAAELEDGGGSLAALHSLIRQVADL